MKREEKKEEEEERKEEKSLEITRPRLPGRPRTDPIMFVRPLIRMMDISSGDFDSNEPRRILKSVE